MVFYSHYVLSLSYWYPNTHINTLNNCICTHIFVCFKRISFSTASTKKWRGLVDNVVVTSENKKRVQQESWTCLICHEGTSSQVPTYIPRTLAQIWKCFQAGITNKQSQNHCFLWCTWLPPGFALLQAGICVHYEQSHDSFC